MTLKILIAEFRLDLHTRPFIDVKPSIDSAKEIMLANCSVSARPQRGIRRNATAESPMDT